MRTVQPAHRRRSLAAAVVIAAAGFGALAGCADQQDEAGYGLPTLGEEAERTVLAASGADVTDLTGTMVVEANGCLMFSGVNPQSDGLARAWIVWPDTTQQDADIVLLPSGRHLGQGSRLDLSGAFVRLADLPDGADDQSYLGSFGRYCGADEHGVLLVVDIAD